MATRPSGDSGIGGLVRERVNPFVRYFQFSALIFVPGALSDRVLYGEISFWDSLKTYLTAVVIFGIVGWAYGTAANVPANPTVEEMVHLSGWGSVPVVGIYVYAVARLIAFTLIFWPAHAMLSMGQHAVGFKHAITIYFVYCAACVPLDAIFIFSPDESIRIAVSLFFLVALFLVISALARLYDRSRLRVLLSALVAVALWSVGIGLLLDPEALGG